MQYFGGNQYEGNWENGKRHGYGIETYYISPFNKDWKDNPKKYWGAYEGSWKDDFKNGHGKMVYVDGSLLYDGDWFCGDMHGQGKRIYPDGGIYEGIWERNLRSYGKMTYPNGNIYEGDWAHNVMHGYGEITATDGKTYVGNWVNSRRSGYGTMFYSDGSIYEGEWRDGERHGHGAMTHSDGRECVGEWRDNKPVEPLCSDGSELTGKMGGRDALGHKRLVYDDGRVYEGECKDGKRYGRGKMMYPGRGTLEGEWINDKVYGYVKIIFSDGGIYLGNYFDDKRYGHGKMIYANKDMYIGDWRYNQRNGRGVITYADGSMYKGSWLGDGRHGHGIMTYPDGKIYDGEWRDDKPVDDTFFKSERWSEAHPMVFSIEAAAAERVITGLIARIKATALNETAAVAAASDKIDATDKRFAEMVESDVAPPEIIELKNKKLVSQRAKAAMLVAAEHAKLENEANRAQLIEESEALVMSSKIAQKSVEAQVIGLSIGSQLNEYDERIAFYSGLLVSLSPQSITPTSSGGRDLSPLRHERSSSPPRADTVIQRAETAVKSAASDFAKRNREVRAQGFVDGGVGTAEYISRIAASAVVDDALPAIGQSIQTLDEWTGGRLLSVLHYVDPKTWGTGVRRGLRDSLGMSQTFSQNAGDIVQYISEVGFLLYTFGAASVSKTVKGAQIAADTAEGAEVAATVAQAVKVTKAASAPNKTARIGAFETSLKENVKLTRYGGFGGGHHIDMKSAFKSHPLYDLNEALCLSNEEMARLGIEHELASGIQHQMCTALIREGKPMTRQALMEISVEALVAGGADRDLARHIVSRSWLDLKSKGIRNPTDMPWGKK